MILALLIVSSFTLIISIYALVAQLKKDAYVELLQALTQHTPSPSESPAPVKMNEEQLKEFVEADKNAADDFLQVLSELNKFMTGIEEETHAEEQNN